MRPFLSVVPALLLLLAGGFAEAAQSQKDVKFSPSRFSEQRGDIIEALEGDRYREISEDAKQQVLQALDRMQARLDGVQSVEQLNADDKVAVFNDQELINTLLTSAAADSQLICRREKTLGSNMRSNACMTVAERRRRQEESQEQLRKIQGSGYLPPGG